MIIRLRLSSIAIAITNLNWACQREKSQWLQCSVPKIWLPVDVGQCPVASGPILVPGVFNNVVRAPHTGNNKDNSLCKVNQWRLQKYWSFAAILVTDCGYSIAHFWLIDNRTWKFCIRKSLWTQISVHHSNHISW